ncbi:MAG: hypothetical protein ACE5H3_11950 [Planctomycetota bacterium]
MSSIFAVLIGAGLAGLLAAVWSGLTGMGTLEASDLGLHRRLALAGAILAVLVHSVVFVYMIGTGRAIKDATGDFGIDPLLYQEHIALKWRAAPWALACTVLLAATAVLGGVAESGGVWKWIHPLAAVLTLLVNLGGFPAEFRAIRDNGALLGRVAEATAARNRARLERGEDPAPPLSSLSPGGWGLVVAVSAWLPARFVMGRPDLPAWPFAVVSVFGILGFLRNLRHGHGRGGLS